MRSYSLLALMAASTLAACVTPGTQLAAEGKNALDSANVCCTKLADAAALPLPVEPQHLRIDGTRQAFLFNGVKSFFVLYRLPEFRKTYSILVTSNPEGTTADSSIFLPRISTYDASFRPIRHFDERTLRSRGGGVERTVFFNPANAGERYLAIHGADLSAPVNHVISMPVTTTIAVGTGFVYWQNGMDVKSTLRPVPVGTVDIEVNGLVPAGG